MDAKKTDQLEKVLDERLAAFGLSYLDKVKGNKSQTPIEDMFKEGYKVYKGDRQSKFLRICGSLIKRLDNILPLKQIKDIADRWNSECCVPPLGDKERDAKFNEAVKKIALEGDQKQVISKLEEMDITPDKYLNDDNLPKYVKDLKKMVNNKVTQIVDPRNVANLADVLIKKYNFKAMEETKELFYYNGKIYHKYGEQKIMQELEIMEQALRPKLFELTDLSKQVDDIIKERRIAKKDTNELTKYQAVLTENLYDADGEQMEVTNGLVSEVVGKVTRKTLINRDMFAVDPNRIENCVLNLNRKKVRCLICEREIHDVTWTKSEHSPDILSLNKFPVNYDPKATCPNFRKALMQICKYNRKLYLNIIKMLGYCIYQSCGYDCAFLLWGDGANMKSVILNVIKSLLGVENVCAVSLHDLCDGDKFYTAQLFGKTANIYHDLPFKPIRNTSKFKVAITGGRMDGQFKNQQIFDFEPYAKHAYSTLPRPLNCHGHIPILIILRFIFIDQSQTYSL